MRQLTRTISKGLEVDEKTVGEVLKFLKNQHVSSRFGNPSALLELLGVAQKERKSYLTRTKRIKRWKRQ